MCDYLLTLYAMKKLIGFMVLSGILVPSLALASVDITLNGSNPFEVTSTSYNEPGYTANSTVDGDVTSSVTSSGLQRTSVGNVYTVNYSVTDSALSTTNASRTVVFNTGGSMPYCSGPMAPGWQVGVNGGGCSRASITVNPGETKDGFYCPMFFTSGCRLPR